MFQIPPFRSSLCLGSVLTQVGALGSALLSKIGALAQAALKTVASVFINLAACIVVAFRRSPIIDDARDDPIAWEGSGDQDAVNRALSVLGAPGARLPDQEVWGAINTLKYGKADGTTALPDPLSSYPPGLSIDQQLRYRLACITDTMSVYSKVTKRLDHIERSMRAYSKLTDRWNDWLFPDSSLVVQVRNLAQELRDFYSQHLVKDFATFQGIADSRADEASRVEQAVRCVTQIEQKASSALTRGFHTDVLYCSARLAVCAEFNRNLAADITSNHKFPNEEHLRRLGESADQAAAAADRLIVDAALLRGSLTQVSGAS